MNSLANSFIDNPLQIRMDAAPMPERRKGPGRPVGEGRVKIFEALSKLAPGQCVEINRGKASCEGYAYTYRRAVGMELSFMVRVSRPGWCRIWRRT